VLKLVRAVTDRAGNESIPYRAQVRPNHLAGVVDAVEKLKDNVQLIKGGV
jgi:hypothetical protein